MASCLQTSVLALFLDLVLMIRVESPMIQIGTRLAFRESGGKGCNPWPVPRKEANAVHSGIVMRMVFCVRPSRDVITPSMPTMLCYKFPACDQIAVFAGSHTRESAVNARRACACHAIKYGPFSGRPK